LSQMLGQDCNDADDLTRPDIATQESNSFVCMTDSDEDGYGDVSASGGGVAGTDCDDGDDTIHPTANEICDGQDNDCTRTNSADGVPLNEVDNDSDGYVECSIDSGGWDTSPLKQGDDCDDGDATENSGAVEICDGQANNCDGSIPLDEVDNDGDGYVECTLNGGWDGAGTKLGDDCDDGDATENPGAVEICDGQANNCDGSIPSDEVDDDGDGYVECTLNGGWDGAGTKLGDDCNDDASNNGATVNPGANEICDGLDNDCTRTNSDDGVPLNEVDNDFDDYVECTIDSGGWDTSPLKQGDDCDDGDATENPGAAEICDGQANNCDGSIPTDEVDNDSDGYVECTIDSGGWDGTGTKLGDDCLDTDATVNPGAAEICDGQANNCDGSIPSDEVDDDGDGYVECTLNGGWDGTGTKLGDDCNDDPNANGATINPGIAELCDGLINNCSLSSLPSNEVDDDGDGYVECTIDSGGWDTLPLKQGDDCNDVAANNGATVHPGMTELCDGIVNLCGGTLPLNEVDGDSDGYVECTIDSGGWDGSGTMLGDDCDDTHALTFPGVASLDSATACMRDADNDNRGSDTVSSGVVAGTDCDDSDATVNPGATELCDGQVNACTTTLGGDEIDNDSDGYVECTIDSGGWDGGGTMLGGDCNDVLANNGATVNPGATELCDGLDNDCSASGSSDGIPLNEVDDDGDGYVECTIDSGGWDSAPTLLGDDCNDVLANNGANVNPGEAEICDASDTDEDCDQGADDNDPEGASGTTPWYADVDGDGFGDENATATQACDAPSGMSATNDDCDDSDGDTAPGAATEDSATACMTDADGDGFGSDTVTGTVQAGSDCDDSSATINTDATEICDTSDTDEDCNGVADDNDSGVTGTTAWYTDSDGDGDGDENDAGVSQCEQPANTSSNNSDCDDSDSNRFGNNTETSDEEDEDCDDLVDEGFRSDGDLVITEVMGNPEGFGTSITEGQWFEVYNPHATVDFHMGGVEVFTNCDGLGGNSASDSFFIPVDGLVVGALDYAVFCHSGSAAGGACDYIFGTDNGATSLGASYNENFDIQTSVTCRISLYFNSRANTLDSVFPRDGTNGWQATVDGVAYCLDPATLTAGENNTGTNWGYPASTELYDTNNYGTPGTAASTCGTTEP